MQPLAAGFYSGHMPVDAASRCTDAALKRTHTMLKWALIFAVIAVVAGLLGFSGVAAGAAGIAKFLFVVFLVICLILFALVLLGVGALKR